MNLTPEDKKEILDHLSKHRLMSVGTYNKLPWAASVYYLFDDDFNMYFVSSPKTLHCRNIEINSKVSVTVADSTQNPSGKKKGFQARGIAKKASSVKEINEIIRSWNKHGFAPLTYKILTKAWKSRFYKIKLTDIKMFDEHQNEENEDRMWKIN